jgi:hypothetical protein
MDHQMNEQLQQPATAEESAALPRFASQGAGAPLSPKYGGPCVKCAATERASASVEGVTNKPALRGA